MNRPQIVERPGAGLYHVKQVLGEIYERRAKFALDFIRSWGDENFRQVMPGELGFLMEVDALGFAETYIAQHNYLSETVLRQ